MGENNSIGLTAMHSRERLESRVSGRADQVEVHWVAPQHCRSDAEQSNIS